MGGLGSGERETKKRTVEECWALDAATLFRRGVPGNSITWTNSVGVRTLLGACWFGFEGSARALHLFVKAGPVGNETAIGEMAIRLVTTRPHFGGMRWWFRCSCGLRSRVLYLPQDARYFRCRTCHGLTYASAQAHDARVDKLCKNLSALRAALESENPGEWFLGFRAYSKLRGWL
jgi:hypothetical protein